MTSCDLHYMRSLILFMLGMNAGIMMRRIVESADGRPFNIAMMAIWMGIAVAWVFSTSRKTEDT